MSARIDTERLLQPLNALIHALPSSLEDIFYSPKPNDVNLKELTRRIRDGTVILLNHSRLFAERGGFTAEELNRRGVELWNLVTQLRRDHSEDGDRKQDWNSVVNVQWRKKDNVLVLLRIFLFLILDCAYKAQDAPSSDTKRRAKEASQNIVRLLKIAFKTATCSIRCVNGYVYDDRCTIVLQRAAEYLETLDGLAKREHKHEAVEEQEERRIVFDGLKMGYLGLRMTAAWKQNNLDVAEMMFNQASELARDSSTELRERLVTLLLEIGQDLYRKKDFYRASKWLERGHALISECKGEDLSADALELNRSVAQYLVRSYGSLGTDASREKAYTVVEWFETEFPGMVSPSILRTELAASGERFDTERHFSALSHVVRTIPLTKSNFNIVMFLTRELMAHGPELSCKALDDFIVLRLLDYSNDDWTHKALLARLSAHTFTPAASAAALDTLEQLFNLMKSRMGGPFEHRIATIGILLLVVRADQHARKEEWQDAEAFCKLALHEIFANIGDGNATKIARRIMMCAISRNDFATARATFNQMPGVARDEALTRYIVYRLSLNEGDKDLAAECFEVVSRNSKEEASLLYACALEASNSGQKREAIQAIRTAMARYENTPATSGMHLPSMLRCTLRLLVSELPAENLASSDIPQEICDVFHGARQAISKFGADPSSAAEDFNTKELEWLATNSYNLALKYYDDWKSELVVKLLDCCTDFSVRLLLPSQPPPRSTSHLLYAHSLVAILLMRLARTTSNDQIEREHYTAVRQHVASFHQHASSQQDAGLDQPSITQVARKLDLADFEAAIHIQHWTDLGGIVSRATSRDPTARLRETLLDMLLSTDAPPATMVTTLQAIFTGPLDPDLHAPHTAAATAKLARQLRILHALMLRACDGSDGGGGGGSAPTATSATAIDKAGGRADDLIRQVLQLLEHGGVRADYPPEELEYLAIATFNRAVDAHVRGDRQACARLGGWARGLALCVVGDEGRVGRSVGQGVARMLGGGEGEG